MEGMIGEPVEPSPPYRPCPRALLCQPLAFPFSQSEAAMSCQRGQERWRASMAAATSNSAAMSCRRGLVRWRASMAAAYHCHPSYYENPTLHIGVR